MPDPRVAQLWTDRTPADFTFNIKAFRLFTGHQTAPSALPKDIVEAMGPIGKKNIYYKDMPVELLAEMWRLYRAGIEPLKYARKLGAVHFQFAPWVAFHPRNLEHIEECQRQLDGFRLSIEFRNRTWFEGEHERATLDFERSRGLVNVVVDEPQGVTNSIPQVWEVTNPELAIVRLHGRNHATWNKKGLSSSAQRFNYDYTDEELGGLAEADRLDRRVERACDLQQQLRRSGSAQCQDPCVDHRDAVTGPHIHSPTLAPDPPISFGRSFSFVTPSLSGRTLSW